MSVLPLYLGMRVKLTKKILPPELVQEASGEIVRIAFHDDEGFWYGRPRGQRLHCPPSDHPCWAIGWVLCDRLPTYVAVRFDKVTEDYTGLEQLGVWHVEPTNDEWKLKYKVAYCVQHPRSPSKKTGHNDNIVNMIRHQIPLAPERVGTYQNQQGKTVRGPEDEPLGHTISLRKPSYMHDDEYKQHLYMILGRAKALKWSLFHDFPSDAQGLPEWKWFESGPPSYVLAFFEALQPRADMTIHSVELARREIRLFPLWRCKPALELVNKDSLEKIYTYDKAAWDQACSASCVGRPDDGHLPAPASAPPRRRTHKSPSDNSQQFLTPIPIGQPMAAPHGAKQTGQFNDRPPASASGGIPAVSSNQSRVPPFTSSANRDTTEPPTKQTPATATPLFDVPPRAHANLGLSCFINAALLALYAPAPVAAQLHAIANASANDYLHLWQRALDTPRLQPYLSKDIRLDI